MKKAMQTAKNAYLRFAKSEKKTMECLLLCGYILALAVFMYFHEPWYDEAQAWLIARDGSLHDLFLVIPHYEGHPPLWFCILAVFAKAGADFDLTIKLLTLFINTGAMALLLFRSPFPRIVRTVLPFTYFLFYQHGVICRPYSLLLLGLLLTAMLWEKRNEKPFPTVLSLMLCCASSAYGIILAGGITLAWIIGIAWKKKLRVFFAELFSGKRLWAFALLLAFALSQIALIFPRADTFAASYGLTGNPIALRLLYMFTGSLADATCFSCLTDYSELRYVVFDPLKLTVGCLLGGLLLCLILYLSRRCGTVVLFAIPFVLFAGFSGTVYFYLQHIDVLFQFLVFWAWVSYGTYRASHAERPLPSFRIFVRTLTACVCAAILGISVYWNVIACRNEVWFTYGFAKDVSTFLDNKGLDRFGIMVRWKHDLGDDGSLYVNTNQTVNGVAINAYYDRNIVINMNGGREKETFANHRIPSDAEMEETIREWTEKGLPAVTLDKVQLGYLFPEYGDVYRSHYVRVFYAPEYHLWKDDLSFTAHYVYVRKDIARKFRLEPAD